MRILIESLNRWAPVDGFDIPTDRPVITLPRLGTRKIDWRDVSAVITGEGHVWQKFYCPQCKMITWHLAGRCPHNKRDRPC